MNRILIVLIIFVTGCASIKRTATTSTVAENNKDVFLLSILIRDHLRKTNGEKFGLRELQQYDTLKRIAHHFEMIELIYRGHISVYYKLSGLRNNKIELSSEENKILPWVKWSGRQLKKPYDGELQFYYGEQGYRRKKIMVKSK